MSKLQLSRFNTIGYQEADNTHGLVLSGEPLSGYLGGELKTGRWVSALERFWCKTFGCTHAIACNSATSGLLAACHAVGVTNEEVVVSPYTMSATAAAPAFLGANLIFPDIDSNYCLDPHEVAKLYDFPWKPKAVIATNLFGHPAQLRTLAQLAHANGAYLIEDNAQAPFATERGVYSGTIGDIGIFSLNVHKHIQSGEGGVVVTDNDDFAHAMRLFINHGEMAGSALGLNLRMTEVTAAIACAQLARARDIIQSRVDLAESLAEGLRDNPLVTIRPPRDNCRHVYYVLPMEVNENVSRSWVVKALAEKGVPLVEGYVAPLYWLPAFREFATRACSVTEKLHKQTLAYFEVCAYDPTQDQIRQIIDAFAWVADYASQETYTPPEGRS